MCRITSYNVCYTKLLRDADVVSSAGMADEDVSILQYVKDRLNPPAEVGRAFGSPFAMPRQIERNRCVASYNFV